MEGAGFPPPSHSQPPNLYPMQSSQSFNFTHPVPGDRSHRADEFGNDLLPPPRSPADYEREIVYLNEKIKMLSFMNNTLHAQVEQVNAQMNQLIAQNSALLATRQQAPPIPSSLPSTTPPSDIPLGPPDDIDPSGDAELLPKFWTQGMWNEKMNEKGAQTDEKVPRLFTRASYLFLLDKNGAYPSPGVVASIASAATDIFTDMAREGHLPKHDHTWKKGARVGDHAKNVFRARFQQRFPDSRRCEAFWMPDYVASQNHSNWKGSPAGLEYFRGLGVTVKSEPKEEDGVGSKKRKASEPVGDEPKPKRTNDGASAAEEEENVLVIETTEIEDDSAGKNAKGKKKEKKEKDEEKRKKKEDKGKGKEPEKKKRIEIQDPTKPASKPKPSSSTTAKSTSSAGSSADTIPTIPKPRPLVKPIQTAPPTASSSKRQLTPPIEPVSSPLSPVASEPLTDLDSPPVKPTKPTSAPSKKPAAPAEIKRRGTRATAPPAEVALPEAPKKTRGKKSGGASGGEVETPEIVEKPVPAKTTAKPDKGKGKTKAKPFKVVGKPGSAEFLCGTEWIQANPTATQEDWKLYWGKNIPIDAKVDWMKKAEQIARSKGEALAPVKKSSSTKDDEEES
ncbi:hypothetical protein MKEN_00988600 [Mycena kentingensis (nom. inval.)]|nr:hypothetical protein MKEN_00988600 [Mycena kentingensis (nom. inval.)]